MNERSDEARTRTGGTSVRTLHTPFSIREGTGSRQMAIAKRIVTGAGMIAGGAVAVAGINATLAATAPALWPVLPGDEKRYSWRDGEIGYTVRGDGPPLLLLHGIYATACGYEM